MKPGVEVPDGRVPCCIIDCGRTFPDDNTGTRTICGRHYRMAPAKLREDMKLLRRVIRRRPSPAAIAMFNRHYDKAVEAINATVTGAPIPASVDAFLASL